MNTALKLEGNRLVASPADRGRTLGADEVARIVWDGNVSPLWVTRKMRSIAHKPGKSLYWYEADAIRFREDYYAREARRAS